MAGTLRFHGPLARPALVCITDCNFPDTEQERAVLAPTGAEVVLHQCRTAEEVIARCRDADALIVQYAPITAAVLDALPRLRAIARYGIGVDTIDVPAATERGVCVANVPGFCVPEVADTVMAMLLAAARRLIPLVDHVRGGGWDAPGVMRGTPRLEGQTLGLLGFGRSARAVVPRARAFGLRVLVASRHASDAEVRALGAERASWEEVLGQADYLSLHLALTPETRGCVDAAAFARMKPGAYLINCARGALVDEPALVAALREGRLAGAMLDVTVQEPLPADSPLRALPNVWITPHAAYYSDGALTALQRSVAEEIARVLRGERPANLVNPEVWQE